MYFVSADAAVKQQSRCACAQHVSLHLSLRMSMLLSLLMSLHARGAKRREAARAKIVVSASHVSKHRVRRGSMFRCCARKRSDICLRCAVTKICVRRRAQTYLFFKEKNMRVFRTPPCLKNALSRVYWCVLRIVSGFILFLASVPHLFCKCVLVAICSSPRCVISAAHVCVYLDIRLPLIL